MLLTKITAAQNEVAWCPAPSPNIVVLVKFQFYYAFYKIYCMTQYVRISIVSQSLSVVANVATFNVEEEGEEGRGKVYPQRNIVPAKVDKNSY